jgi:hypothetical protein
MGDFSQTAVRMCSGIPPSLTRAFVKVLMFLVTVSPVFLYVCTFLPVICTLSYTFLVEDNRNLYSTVTYVLWIQVSYSKPYSVRWNHHSGKLMKPNFLCTSTSFLLNCTLESWMEEAGFNFALNLCTKPRMNASHSTSSNRDFSLLQLHLPYNFLRPENSFVVLYSS